MLKKLLLSSLAATMLLTSSAGLTVSADSVQNGATDTNSTSQVTPSNSDSSTGIVTVDRNNPDPDNQAAGITNMSGFQAVHTKPVITTQNLVEVGTIQDTNTLTTTQVAIKSPL